MKNRRIIVTFFHQPKSKSSSQRVTFWVNVRSIKNKSPSSSILKKKGLSHFTGCFSFQGQHSYRPWQ
ncbi:MAG: hypothetical protein ACI85O_003569, partial [Saprospiraceae bacterium]